MLIHETKKIEKDTVKSSTGKTRFGFGTSVNSEFGTPRLLYELPWIMKPSAEYVFFLHGRTVEMMGLNGIHPRFGIYDYYGIVTALKLAGFTVICEIRPKRMKLDKYAGKIVRQINTLMTNGISPGQITVVGFSKGNLITLLVSATLLNPGINFVMMSGCEHKRPHVHRSHSRCISRSLQTIKGQFLSVYDVANPKCTACRRIFNSISDDSTFKEVELKIGMGHRLFYQPRKEWLEPVMEWIHRKRPARIDKAGCTISDSTNRSFERHQVF